MVGDKYVFPLKDKAGSQVTPNPTLQGNEDSLDGLEVDGVKFKVDKETYNPFPSTWNTTGTISQFFNSVNTDASAIEGMAYLGELRCSDLPTGLVNVEAVVQVMSGSGTSNKVLHLVITSGNVAPYRWEYTYWNNGVNVSGWIGFQNELSVDNTTIQLNNNQLSVKGLPYLTQAPVADNNDGTLKIVVLTQEPATYYNGYDYKIVEEVV